MPVGKSRAWCPALLFPVSEISQATVYSVSQLNLAVQGCIESAFPFVVVEGEISNLATPASGHIYFSLKDTQSQVRCAMFRARTRLGNLRPNNGLHVRVRARVSLYTPRGDYQLIVKHLEVAGEGALREAFEALKRKLDAEGLFAPERKRALPYVASRIGIVTSPSGAAVRDVLHVLNRRFPAIPVAVFPASVQGPRAASELRSALRQAARHCDVIILTRGGGSLEDLQAFNDEQLVRDIAALDVPVVSGIGHEIDFTIADFVADLRAPTPSAAAEAVTLEQAGLNALFDEYRERLQRAAAQQFLRQQNRLIRLRARLIHPAQRLHDAIQKLDELTTRMAQAERQQLEENRRTLLAQHSRLWINGPQRQLELAKSATGVLSQRLALAGQTRVREQRQRLARVSGLLNALSPLATLQRGYSITSGSRQNLITSVADVSADDTLETRVSDGVIHSKVSGTTSGTR